MRFKISTEFCFALAVLPLQSCDQDPAFTEYTIKRGDANATGGDGMTCDEASPNFADCLILKKEAEDKLGTNKGTAGGEDKEEPKFYERESDPGLEPGRPTKLVKQDFRQGVPGKVDILWIVDVSGSMHEEQDYLGDNFGAFIGQLVNSKVDFQTAVTNTDVCQDELPANPAERVCPTDDGSSATHLRGSFVGSRGAQVLKQSDSGLAAMFREYTGLGTGGSSFEHGLTAAKLAVDKVVSGENDPLMRAGAFLAVIVVSDEEDDGIGLSQADAYTGTNYHARGNTTYKFTEDNFITHLRGIKPDNRFSVSTITGTRISDRKMCTSPHSNPLEEGSQYIKAAQKTGGIVQSICATNWDQSLAKIGGDLSAQISQIQLAKPAIRSTIRVFVNGVHTEQWKYVEAANSVKFNPASIPEAGAKIEVEYLVYTD